MPTPLSTSVVPAVRAGVDWSAVRLTPTHMYVLSRVDGQLTIGEIVAATGIGHQTTMSVLRELASLGIVALGADAPVRTGRAPPGEEDVELPRAVRQRIDEMFARLGYADAYLLLEVEHGADIREIKRSYFKLAKEFHPDRYYGKRLGPYGERLRRIFDELTRAHDLLSDDRRREEYDEHVQVQRHAEQRRREREEHEHKLSGQFGRLDAPGADGDGRAEPRGPARATPAPRSTGGVPAPGIPGKPKTLQPGAIKAAPGPRRLKTISPVKAPPAPRRSVEEEAEIQRARLAESQARRQRLGWDIVQARKQRAQNLYDQGLDQMRKGDLIAAVETIELALRLEPGQAAWEETLRSIRPKVDRIVARSHARRAQLEEKGGRFAVAAAQWARAADLSGEVAGYHRAALCYERAGELLRAKEHARRAAELDPRNVEARATLARILLQTGERAQAVREAEQALAMNPDNKSAREVVERARGS